MTPPSRQSAPCTHQHPFGTFSYQGMSGGVRTTLTGFSSSTFSENRPPELWREQNEVRISSPGRAGQDMWVSPEQLAQGPDHLPLFPSHHVPFWMTLNPVPTSLFSQPSFP